MNKRPSRQRPARSYRSELRAEQAGVTTEKILDAVERRLAAGDRELSYTAIAREARVSVPTVYRHFPTRQDLFQAMFLRTDHPRVEDDLDFADPAVRHASLRALFRRLEGEPGAKVGRLNTLWEFSRATTVPSRRRLVERMVDQRCPTLREPQRTWLVEVCVVLISSAMAEAFRGYLSLDADAIADRVGFTLESLLAAHAPEEG